MRAKENPGMRAGEKIAPHCNGPIAFNLGDSAGAYKSHH